MSTYRIRETRYPELVYILQAPGLWRIVSVETDDTVGPHYHSERELLSDLNRFAESYGCN